MRKQNKTTLWPIYFDSAKTRKEGRRVPKNLAVPNPNLAELQKAAEHLGLKPEADVNMAHPAMPWQKAGRIWVQNKGKKGQLLIRIAKEISAVRQKASK